MTPASVHVLTNPSLFHNITAFIAGVPNIIGEFKNHEFAEHLQRYPKNDGWPRQGVRHFSLSMTKWMLHELLMWQVAVLNENKRVFAVLNELSKTPHYAVVPHVLCVDIMGYAIARSRDAEFLEWIYCNFTEEHHRQISVWDFRDAGQLGSVEVVCWADSRGYVIPPDMMDIAAGSGQMDLVRYLHEHE